MYFFALARPIQLAYSDDYLTDEFGSTLRKNSILAQTVDGIFIDISTATSDSTKALIRDKQLSVGIAATPAEAIVKCLKNCIFKRQIKLLPIFQFPDNEFSIKDIDTETAIDAAILILEFYRRNLIELLRIQ